MLHLPPLSKHIRVLNAEESARLDAEYPSTLPKSLKDCPTCRGKKSFKWYKDHGNSDEVGEYVCPCGEQFVLFKFLLNAGIGLRYQRYGVGDLDQVPNVAIAMANDYLENADYYIGQGVGLHFHGDRGTGKTLLATVLLKQMLNEGVDGHFIAFDQMVRMYMSSWKDEKKREWFEAMVRNSPLLVVDDIGKEYKGLVKVSSTMIDNVFRTRVNNALPTIITTNLTLDELRESYGSSLETIAGQARYASFTGKSYRESELETERFRFELENKLTRPIMIH